MKSPSKASYMSNNNRDSEEEFENDEILPPSKQIRNHYYKRMKENEIDNEYSPSSEEFSQDEEVNNGNKNNNKYNELIEITDLDINEMSSLPRQKKSTKRQNKKEKTYVKSVKIPKGKAKSKSPISRNRGKHNFSNIDFDENNNDEDIEIEILTNESVDSSNKNISENLSEKFINRRRKINNKNIKNRKKNKKDESLEQQMEFESVHEDEDEDEDENQDEDSEYEENNTLKKRGKNCPFSKSPENLNSINLFCNKIPNNNNLKSRSIIKTSSKKNKSNRMNDLLGKKRKPENNIDKSLFSRKKSDKTFNENKKSSSTDIIDLLQPKRNKTRSVTPNRINYRKNKMGIETDQKLKESINLNISELDVLNKLEKEYGLESVINSLCKPKLNLRNELDSYLLRLKDSYDNSKIAFILCKMLYIYFNSKIKVSEVLNNQKTKPSSSFNSDLKSNSCAKSDNSFCTDTEKEFPGEIPSESDDKDKEEKILKSKNKRKKDTISQGRENSWTKMLKIGPHYNKDETGKIFKYQIVSFDQSGSAFFKCIDDKCNAMGIYNFEVKKFEIIYKHNLNYEDHEYIKYKEMDSDEIFKSLTENDKTDAQVFKEYKERIFKYY